VLHPDDLPEGYHAVGLRQVDGMPHTTDVVVSASD
jgi:hypothetical protein